jgi:hypothetical protein
MTLTPRRLAAALPLLVMLLVACGQATSSGSVPASPSAAASGDASAATGSFDQAAAEQYCTSQGGMLVPRVATWNTNGDASTWLELAGRMTFCEFESTQDANTTRIAVDLLTLYSEEPTLAAIAYLSKTPPKVPPNPGANPAEYNCREGLAGSSSFGTGAAGGGWVDKSQPVFVVMDMCVFADMSAIDEFGLFYHQNGSIRGADLATKMRYQPGNKLPAIFGN